MRTTRPTGTLVRDKPRSLVRCLVGGALAGGPKPGTMEEVIIRDPTTLAVLWVDGGHLARRQLRMRHDTSTRRVPPFLRTQPTWKTWGSCNVDPSPIEQVCHLLQSHKTDRPHPLVEVGGFPVGL